MPRDDLPTRCWPPLSRFAPARCHTMVHCGSTGVIPAGRGCGRRREGRRTARPTESHKAAAVGLGEARLGECVPRLVARRGERQGWREQEQHREDRRATPTTFGGHALPEKE
eukprot:1741413-Prymnesium_polylepis.1